MKLPNMVGILGFFAIPGYATLNVTCVITQIYSIFYRIKLKAIKSPITFDDWIDFAVL